jgi:hypothetical protein
MTTQEIEAIATKAIHDASEYTQQFMDGELDTEQLTTIAKLWETAADAQLAEYSWHNATLGELLSELQWLQDGNGVDHRPGLEKEENWHLREIDLYHELWEIINDAQPEDFDYENADVVLTIRVPRWVMNTACEITGMDPDGDTSWDDKPEPHTEN